MITVNYQAHDVPHTVRGNGEWYIASDSLVLGEVIVTDRQGKTLRRVPLDELKPYDGYFFHVAGNDTVQ